MSRRRFVFWIGVVLFWSGRKLHASSIDEAAATLMEWSEAKAATDSKLERWRTNANRKWHWYERQTRIDGRWKRSGITTPIDRRTGALYTGRSGYLDESLVPTDVRTAAEAKRKRIAGATADPTRRQDHGQPPSRWLRSLNADEIRLWLRTIEVPEFGVEGVTFWTHLTEHHSFSADRIRGLTIPEQAKLHAAAHHGY